MNNELFKFLNDKFSENGFSIFEVGGSVRDSILGLDVFDYDFATDATPEEMMGFLPDASDVFAKFGCIKYKGEFGKAEITTFRVEDDYGDYRHPNKIKFVKTLNEDYKRRDFTINALYKDYEGNIFDPSRGLEDIKNKKIRFIGDPKIRIKEDPLRIIRAKRFAKKLNFSLEENTSKAIDEMSSLLEKLNPQKVFEEEKKNK